MEELKTINARFETCETEEQRKQYQKELDIFKSILEHRQLNEKSIVKYTDKLSHNDYKAYKAYPFIEQLNFNQLLYDSKEFRDLKYIKNINDGTVRLKQSQEFIKLFLSPDTGYNSLLIYHGVGVGKTCAAISSAEPVKNNYKKIHILSPNLTQNWKDELFNIDKEINKKPNTNVQCTGNTYSKLVADLIPNVSEIPTNISFYNIKQMIKENKVSYASFEDLKERNTNFNEHQLDSIKKELDLHIDFIKNKMKKIIYKKINSNYLFFGFLKFAKDIENKMKGFQYEYQKINFIKKNYSRCIFILDEVQHIKSKSYNDDDEKKILKILDYIVRYGVDNKLILLSATPMYDTSLEIVQILNLLLLNDKKAPIFEEGNTKYITTNGKDKKILFDKNNNLTKEGVKILKLKSKGYISYLKGIDPENFPRKLWPNKKRLKNVGIDINLYDPLKKTRDLSGNIIPDEERINIEDIKIISATMKEHQMKEYLKNSDTEGFNVKIQQLSNIVTPEGVSISSCIKSDKNNKYHIHNKGILDDKTFLDKENLSNFSSKFSHIINCVNKSRGIVLIHSKWLDYGIKTLALALELQGYREFSLKDGNVRSRLVNNNYQKYRIISKNSEGEFITEEAVQNLANKKKVARYIILSGDVSDKVKNELIRIARGENKAFPNNEGETIKIILTTINEGISFKRVRQIHVMNSWWHLNLIEQIIGRGIRNQSHDGLPDKQKNVTVFYYACSYPLSSDKGSMETFDEHMYRTAYIKDKKISHIESVIRMNSIDCQLNKNTNTIKISNNPTTDKNGIFIQDSFGGDLYKYTRNDLFRKDNLYEDTNIQKTFKCIGDINKEKEIKLDNEVTNNIYNKNELFSLSVVENKIKNIYGPSILNYPRYSFTIEEIIKKIEELPVNAVNVYRALNNLIDKKEYFTDQFGRSGYIVYNNKYYIFQPNKQSDIPNNMNDISIPINIRNKLLTKYNDKINKNYGVKNNNYNEIKLNLKQDRQIHDDKPLNIKSFFSFLFESLPVFIKVNGKKQWYPKIYNNKSDEEIQEMLIDNESNYSRGKIIKNNIYFYNNIVLSLKDIYISKLYSYINKSDKLKKKKLCQLLIKSDNSYEDDDNLKEFLRPEYQKIYIPKYEYGKDANQWNLDGEKIKFDYYSGEYPIKHIIETILENQGILIPKLNNKELIKNNAELNEHYRAKYLNKNNSCEKHYLFFRIVEKILQDTKIIINQYIYNKRNNKINEIKYDILRINNIEINTKNFNYIIGFNVKDEKDKFLNKIIMVKDLSNVGDTRNNNTGKVCNTYKLLIDEVSTYDPTLKSIILCHFIFEKQREQLIKLVNKRKNSSASDAKKIDKHIEKIRKMSKWDISQIVKNNPTIEGVQKIINENHKRYGILGKDKLTNIQPDKSQICEFLVDYLIKMQLNENVQTITEQYKKPESEKINKTYFISHNYKFFTKIQGKQIQISKGQY